MQYTGSSAAGTYYFQRNLLGDVVGIYNTAGTKVAGYAYDAWGNCTITLDANGIATRNPIRYRGYYYDEDTKLYYLNARYYNPEWRRFISPDDTGYLDPETPNGLNLYTYCGNDPVSCSCNISSTASPQTIQKSINYIEAKFVCPRKHGLFCTPLDFEVGVATPKKNDLPGWFPLHILYVAGSLGGGFSIASLRFGVLDFEIHSPKIQIFPDDNWLSNLNPDIYFGLGTLNGDISIGAGISGTIEIVSGTLGVLLGDIIKVGAKGYIGFGFSFDFSNGFS
ncbi:MAG: RHS repeat-associated core domain-containing protein, partial [Clostridia bacterium]|nr:RHS repeat-associated core domain-containing protein [Clostridia bacterium]